jgi:hypothetical protein
VLHAKPTETKPKRSFSETEHSIRVVLHGALSRSAKMGKLIGSHARIAAMAAVCFGLMGQLATSGPRAYYFLVVASEQDSSLSQESVGSRKIMNHKSTSLRMRAFRVIERQRGNYSRWIVLLDIELAQFRVANSISFGGGPTKGMKAIMDRDDAWAVLNSLRNVSRLAVDAGTRAAVADSIDAAISQEEISRQEFSDHALRSTTPSSAPREHEPSGKRSEPMAMAIPGGSQPEEELQQMIKEVWDFAGGKRLKWKPTRPTPTGRRCDVLTFDGAETVLVSPTSVEVSK